MPKFAREQNRQNAEKKLAKKIKKAAKTKAKRDAAKKAQEDEAFLQMVWTRARECPVPGRDCEADANCRAEVEAMVREDKEGPGHGASEMLTALSDCLIAQDKEAKDSGSRRDQNKIDSEPDESNAATEEDCTQHCQEYPEECDQCHEIAELTRASNDDDVDLTPKQERQMWEWSREQFYRDFGYPKGHPKHIPRGQKGHGGRLGHDYIEEHHGTSESEPALAARTEHLSLDKTGAQATPEQFATLREQLVTCSDTDDSMPNCKAKKGEAGIGSRRDKQDL